MQIVIVTGLSGAGKSTALRALEDIEFFCVDNIPMPLVAQMVDHLAQEGDRDKLAIAIDSRQRRNLGAWAGALAKLRGAGHRLEVMFLEASDEVLLRRYSETRRRHPLSGDGLTEGVRRDREVMGELRHGAAVAEGGRAALLLGPGGAGKTTTALAAWNAGMDYLGDDYVLVRVGPHVTGARAYATAKADARTATLLPSVVDLGAREYHRGDDDKTVLQLAGARGLDVIEARVVAVVVPRVAPRARLEAIEPGAAPAEEEEDTLEHALTARLPATTEAPDPEAPPDRASDGHQAPRRPSSRA